MRLRWKKQPRHTGLAAVAAPPRSSAYTDGSVVYAIVSPLGGGWRPLLGWYWYTMGEGLPRMNTCDSPTDEATAKKQAIDWSA